MKISKFIYAAVVGGVLASCQSVDTPMFSDKDAFVAFDSKSTSIAENAGSEVKIPVSLVASKGLDVSVGFEIDTTAYAGKNAAKEGVPFEKYVEYFVVYRWRRDGRLHIDRTYR